MNVLMLRVSLLVLGIAVWGYGVRTDDSRTRLIGIGILAVSLILRFFRRKPTGRD